MVLAHAEDRLQTTFEPKDFSDGTVGKSVTEEDYKVLDKVRTHLPNNYTL